MIVQLVQYWIFSVKPESMIFSGDRESSEKLQSGKILADFINFAQWYI